MPLMRSLRINGLRPDRKRPISLSTSRTQAHAGGDAYFIAGGGPLELLGSGWRVPSPMSAIGIRNCLHSRAWGFASARSGEGGAQRSNPLTLVPAAVRARTPTLPQGGAVLALPKFGDLEAHQTHAGASLEMGPPSKQTGRFLDGNALRWRLCISSTKRPGTSVDASVRRPP
jgi:hypothetical protein